MSRDERRRLQSAFDAFASAAEEADLPEDAWRLGWTD
jgi:hypothetical protein